MRFSYAESMTGPLYSAPLAVAAEEAGYHWMVIPDSICYPPVKIAPVPAEPIPLLIGGHCDAALRRAALVADGWLHGGGDPADLPGLLGKLARFRREEGTQGRPFEVHVIFADAYTADGVRRLAETGVTDLIVGFRWPYTTGPDTEPLEDKLAHLRRYADTVIAKLRAPTRSDFW